MLRERLRYSLFGGSATALFFRREALEECGVVFLTGHFPLKHSFQIAHIWTRRALPATAELGRKSLCLRL